jgi:myo-inositol 2-dehydrogenase / D-chiro-inositol 1-dehydrogenase
VPHPEDPMGFWSSTQAENGLVAKTAWQPLDAAVPSDAAYFLDCLEQDRESDVPARVGVHTVETVLAAYRSAASGEMVRI